jgi:adenylate kinase family enzyme
MKGAVLILGAPGAGKSVLGDALCTAHSATVHAFLNVGQHLKHPSAAGKAELQQLARGMLSAACQQLAEASQAADDNG